MIDDHGMTLYQQFQKDLRDEYEQVNFDVDIYLNEALQGRDVILFDVEQALYVTGRLEDRDVSYVLQVTCEKLEDGSRYKRFEIRPSKEDM